MMRNTRFIIPGLMILVGIGFFAETVQAQRNQRARRSRSEEMLRERLEDRLKTDTTDAIKLLNQDFTAFTEKYLDSDAFGYSEEKPVPSEIERMRNVLNLFAAAPLLIMDENQEAVLFVKMTEEESKAFAPPSPVKKKTEFDVTGYGDDISKVIRSGLADLQAKNYQDFINKLYPLAELEQLKEEEQESWVVEQLSENEIQLKQLQQDFQQLLSIEATITNFQGMTLAVFQISTGKNYPNANQYRYQFDELGAPSDRIVAFEKVGKNWRFVDGNKQAREALQSARGGLSRDGFIQLRWELKDSEWRIVEIPFF
ncbi:hypothetical protein [Rubinisphaera italica]|uniref:Uncharacterized protein n=1 Tax=Rubinisphaera italica TaxID=2527969 RepID=A0A5C5XIZ3_9PLAN|nr:hypothetical protein [Rubinisphaera italica]TWT62283.1 hypothetical protein Pan54_30240 [Rubinisphaera italica]